jgi:hypothetical protein
MMTFSSWGGAVEIAGYSQLRSIGAGATSEVFEAFDNSTGKIESSNKGLFFVELFSGTLNQWIYDCENSVKKGCKIVKSEAYNLGGRQGTKMEVNSGIGGIDSVIFLPNGEYSIVITFTEFGVTKQVFSTLKFIEKTTIPEKPVTNSKPCFVGGCSSQLCTDNEDGAVSTCEWQPQYICYKTAKCERQSNGQCGWTNTPSLQRCLATPPLQN